MYMYIVYRMNFMYITIDYKYYTQYYMPLLPVRYFSQFSLLKELCISSNCLLGPA